MASTIAAITTGIGGIVTTADATGNLSLLSGTSTVVAVTSAGAAVTGTMSVSGATTLTGGLNTPLAVTSGGTGLGTLTANNVILGAGTSNPTFVAPSTTGNVLTSNGTTWTSAAAPASGVTTFNGSTTGLTPATATSGAITLGGTLAVANGGTGVTTSTGSGAVVLGTSPTLVTPVINGFTGDTSVINIGSGQVYKDASGNVGIGTALPRKTLSINGGFAFQTAGGANRSIHWGDETTSIFPILIAGNATSGSESLTFQTNVFGSAATERMRIDSSGNVGIGTTSPSSYGKFGVVSGATYFGVASETYTSGKFGPRPANDGIVSVIHEYGGSGSGSYWKTDASSGSFGMYRIGTIVAEWDSSSNFKFNSGYGSAATAYGCRAWVNFNGTGTVAIRASGNVSSITDNAVGQYTVNFTTAMVDVNYSAIGTVSDLNAPGSYETFAMLRGGFTTGSCPVDSVDYTSNNRDVPYNCWAFFR